VFLLRLRLFSRLPGTAAAGAAHITSRPSIAAAAARNMLGIGMGAVAVITAVAVTTAVEDITAVEDTMVAAMATTIKATTIKAADRG
jgi:hypothetical protein